MYYWINANREDVQGNINLDDSGLCMLDVKGESIIDSACSSVAVFENEESLYCLESFEEEVLVMKGKQLFHLE